MSSNSPKPILTKRLEVCVAGFDPMLRADMMDFVALHTKDPSNWDRPIKSPDFLFRGPEADLWLHKKRGYKLTFVPYRLDRKILYSQDHSDVQVKLMISPCLQPGVHHLDCRVGRWECQYQTFEDFKITRKRGIVDAHVQLGAREDF